MHDPNITDPDWAPYRPAFSRLADFICSRKEQICSQWLAAIRRDASIPSTEANPDPLLIDHVPALLDQIVNLLRSPANELLPPDAVKDAQLHGTHRVEQGYQLSEMLQELATFRTIIIGHTGAFADGDAQFTGMARTLATARMHRILDESVRWSTVRFVEEQQALLTEAGAARLRVLLGISHELGNVVNGISFATRALRSPDAARIKEVEKSVGRGIQHMKEMLDDLRSLANLSLGQENLSIQPFALLGLAEDMETTYRPMAEDKGLAFFCETDPALSEVMSDERRVKQVLANLISNAIKYTGAGEVRVEFRAVDGDKWAAAVTDTGVGIAPEHQQKIFDEFFRVDLTSAAEGMGLGLAVATRQVQLLGGETRVASTVGKGSRFEVVLPKVLSAPGCSSNQAADRASRAASTQ